MSPEEEEEENKNVQVFEEDCGRESGQEHPGGRDVRQGHFEYAGHPRTV